MVRVRAGRWSVVAGAIVTWASSSAAEPGKLVLRWDVPSECPTEAEVLRSVEQLLGASDVALDADATVEPRAGGFHLSLRWRTAAASATRELEGEACGELAQAAALMIALAAEPSLATPSGSGAAVAMADPDAPSGEPPPPAPPRDGTPAARSEAPAALPPAPPGAVELSRPQPPARPVVSPRLGGAVDAGSLPRASVAGFAGAGLRYGRYGLIVDGLAFAPKQADRPAGSGRFWLAAASIRPCFWLGEGALRVAPCAAAELHAMPSRGLRVQSFEERVAWFLRLGAGAELTHALTPKFRFMLGGSVLLAPARPRFVVDAEEVFRPAFVAWRGQLGFELDF